MILNQQKNLVNRLSNKECAGVAVAERQNRRTSKKGKGRRKGGGQGTIETTGNQRRCSVGGVSQGRGHQLRGQCCQWFRECCRRGIGRCEGVGGALSKEWGNP
jgi:hypothetical protein